MKKAGAAGYEASHSCRLPHRWHFGMRRLRAGRGASVAIVEPHAQSKKESIWQLGRVLINAQMSDFGDEAEILCSTRALPVLTRTRPYHHLTRCRLAVALLVCCWSARSCRRRLRLGLRGRGLRRGDGNAVEPPPVANYLEHEIEIGLLRPRRDVAGQMQHAALIERGHDC